MTILEGETQDQSNMVSATPYSDTEPLIRRTKEETKKRKREEEAGTKKRKRDQYVQRATVNTYKRTRIEKLTKWDAVKYVASGASLGAGAVGGFLGLKAQGIYGRKGAEALGITGATQDFIGKSAYVSPSVLATFSFGKSAEGTAQGVTEFIEDGGHTQVKRVTNAVTSAVNVTFVTPTAAATSMNSSFEQMPDAEVNNVAAFWSSQGTNNYWINDATQIITNKVVEAAEKPEDDYKLVVNTINQVEKDLRDWFESHPEEALHLYAKYREASSLAESLSVITEMATHIQKNLYDTPEKLAKFENALFGDVKPTAKDRVINAIKGVFKMLSLVVLIGGIAITLEKLGTNISPEMFKQILPHFIGEYVQFFGTIWNHIYGVSSGAVNSIENVFGGFSIYNLMFTVFNPKAWSRAWSAGPANFTFVMASGLIAALSAGSNALGQVGLSYLNPVFDSATAFWMSVINRLKDASTGLGTLGLSIVGYKGILLDYLKTNFERIVWADTVTMNEAQLQNYYQELDADPAKQSRFLSAATARLEESLNTFLDNLKRNDPSTNYAFAANLAAGADQVQMEQQVNSGQSNTVQSAQTTNVATIQDQTPTLHAEVQVAAKTGFFGSHRVEMKRRREEAAEHEEYSSKKPKVDEAGKGMQLV